MQRLDLVRHRRTKAEVRKPEQEATVQGSPMTRTWCRIQNRLAPAQHSWHLPRHPALVLRQCARIRPRHQQQRECAWYARTLRSWLACSCLELCRWHFADACAAAVPAAALSASANHMPKLPKSERQLSASIRQCELGRSHTWAAATRSLEGCLPRRTPRRAFFSARRALRLMGPLPLSAVAVQAS